MVPRPPPSSLRSTLFSTSFLFGCRAHCKAHCYPLQVSAKVGRSDETVNIGYNQEVERFKAQLKLMKKLISHLTDYLKSLKGSTPTINALTIAFTYIFLYFTYIALGAAHAGLNEGISSFYDMASDLWTANLKNQEVGLALDKYRQGLVSLFSFSLCLL
mgnify:FL=1